MDEQICAKALPKQAREAAALARELLGGDLVGVYLYGSATLGGLRPDSDLDILIVIDGNLSDSARSAFTARLLEISGRVGCLDKRPLEVTVIDINAVVPWHFPPRCEFLYGEWLRPRIEAGDLPEPHENPDAAILLWQARKLSVPICGAPARKVIPAISQAEVKMAIANSLAGLLEWLVGDERNVLLTLARMWYTLSTGEICAKDAAARWACARLPEEDGHLLEIAGRAYLGKCADDWTGCARETQALAELMRAQIAKLLAQ